MICDCCFKIIEKGIYVTWEKNNCGYDAWFCNFTCFDKWIHSDSVQWLKIEKNEG